MNADIENYDFRAFSASCGKALQPCKPSMQFAGTLCSPANPPCSLQGHFATLQTLYAHQNGHFAHLQCLKTTSIKGVSPMKINPIGLNRLRNDANFQFHAEFRKARTQLDEAYYAIAERVNAFVVIEGAASYEPFIRKMNINIAKFNLLATQASKKPGKRGGGIAE